MKKTFILTVMTVLISLGFAGAARSERAEWITEGNTTIFTDQIGFSPDGTSYSGTVSLRRRLVVTSGQTKIITTILDIEPAPGFSYNIKKERRSE